MQLEKHAAWHKTHELRVAHEAVAPAERGFSCAMEQGVFSRMPKAPESCAGAFEWRVKYTKSNSKA